MARPVLVLLALVSAWQASGATFQSDMGDGLDPSPLGGLSSDQLNALLEGTVTMPYVLVPSQLMSSVQKRHYSAVPSRFRSEQYQVCRPSSNDIVKFLHALHLARSGSANQLARLCSDGRPASEIDTNVRFIG